MVWARENDCYRQQTECGRQVLCGCAHATALLVASPLLASLTANFPSTCPPAPHQVVFGRACALRVQEILKPGTPHPPLPADAGQETIARLDKLRCGFGLWGRASGFRAESYGAMHAGPSLLRLL